MFCARTGYTPAQYHSLTLRERNAFIRILNNDKERK